MRVEDELCHLFTSGVHTHKTSDNRPKASALGDFRQTTLQIIRTHVFGMGCELPRLAVIDSAPEKVVSVSRN